MIILSQNISYLALSPIGYNSGYPPEIISLQVYSTPTYITIPSGNPYYVGVSWQQAEPNTISSYNVYKSVIGFQTPTGVPFGLVAGDTLILEVSNPTQQTITFTQDYTDINALVSVINNVLVGATAYAVNDSKLLVRNNTPGYMNLVGGTALAKFGQVPGMIIEKSNVFLLVQSPYGINGYSDLNGFESDWYAISTTNTLGVESLRSALISARNSPYSKLCYVQGYIINLQGQRVADVRISAKVEVPPQGYEASASMLQEEVYTLSQEDGSFSLPLLQGSKVYLEINRTKVSEHVVIPFIDTIRWDALPLSKEYYDYKDKLFL